MLSARLGSGGALGPADGAGGPGGGGAALPAAAAAVVAAAALFERLLPAAGAGMGGWGASSAVYEQALAAAPLEVRAPPQPRCSAPPASGLSTLRARR